MSIPVIKFKDENGNIIDVVAIRGYSAYHTAVKYGFKGSEREWYESLFGLVDNEINGSSSNVVSNQAVKAYIDSLFGDVETAIESINAMIGG